MDQMIWTSPLRFENQPARREHNRASETDERTLRRRNRNISNPPPPSSPSHIPISTNYRPRRRLLSTGDIFDNMRGGSSKAYQRDIMSEKERNAELAKLAREAGRNEPAGGKGKDISTPTLRGLLRRASVGIKNRPHTRRPSHTSFEEPAESYVATTSRPSTSASTWHKLKNAASFTSAHTCTIEERSPNLDAKFEYSSDERSIHSAYAAPILGSAHNTTNFRNEAHQPHPGQFIEVDPEIPLPGRGTLPPYIPSRNGGGAAARATAAAQNEVLAQVRRLTMHESRDSGSLDWESGDEMGMSNLTPVDSFRASPRSSTNSGVSGRRSRCKVERIDFTAYLPNEISAHIFGLLDAATLTRCELVSRKWRNIVLTPAIWRDSLFHHKSSTFSLGRCLLPNEGLGLPKKESTQDWKQLYKAKTQVESNWKNGHCKASYLNGHTDSVYCLQFDEHKILTGSRDRTIRIWDLRTHRCLAVIASAGFEFNKRNIDNWTSERPVIPTNPDGQRLPTNRNGQPLQQQGPGTPGEEERITSISTLVPAVYKHATHHDASILCLQYDTSILVTGSSDHTAIIHDMKPPYAPVARLSAHRSAVLDVAFDDKHIVTASKDNNINVYLRPRQLPNGSWTEARLVTTLSGHTAPVNSVQINGSSIVSCSGDFSVKLWNLSTGTCVREFEGHKKGLACSQFSADGRYIASAGNDKVIRVWDARTGQCLREQAAHEGLVRCLFWDNTSGRLISGSYDQDILLWDMKDKGRDGGEMTGREGGRDVEGMRKQVEWKGWHGSWVLAAKGDWRRMVSAGQDRRVLVCDFGDGVRGVEHLESAGVDADGKECRGGKVGRYDGEGFKKIGGKRVYGGKE